MAKELGQLLTKKNEKGHKAERQSAFFRELVASNGITSVARRKLDISRQTLFNWRKSEDFCEREAEVADALEAAYLGMLRQCAEAGNVVAIIFALKSLRPSKYDDAVRKQATESEDRRQPVTLNFVKGPPRQSVISQWLTDSNLETVPKERS